MAEQAGEETSVLGSRRLNGWHIHCMISLCFLKKEMASEMYFMLANVSEKTDSINSSPPTWFNPKWGYLESQNASPDKMVFFLDFVCLLV